MHPDRRNASDAPGATFRSGFVAFCGRPNVGKSSLVNALIGQLVAVVSEKPQMTRQRMLGVYTTPAFQAVLVDTPGIHEARSHLNQHMVGEALRGASDVDLICMLAEMPKLTRTQTIDSWAPGAGALHALSALARLGPPIALLVTKSDRAAAPHHIAQVIERWRSHHAFVATLAVSARTGEGLDALRRTLPAYLPEGPAYFPADQISDRDLRWHAAELIRGELFQQLGQELPYSCAVVVQSYDESSQRDRISAKVLVERTSQQGIVIGAGARTIRAISQAARQRIAELTGRQCDLFLTVAVEPDWTRDAQRLARLGYSDGDEVGRPRARGPA